MENKIPSVQKRFWIDWKLDTQKSSYNMSFEYKICGELDLMALTKALKYYVSVVNPFCSSKFIKKDNDIISIFIPEHILNFRIENEPLGKDNSLKLRERFFFEPFDLESGPVYRFLLIKDNDCSFFLVCFHHIVFDNQTYSRFLKTISESYCNFLLNKNELLPRQGPLKEFIEHENIAIKQVDLNLCLEDFTADNLYVQLFPESFSLESHYSLSGRSFTFEIDSFLFKKLGSFLKKNDISYFMVIIAAYGALLKFHGNLSSVSINYPTLLVPKRINNLNGSFVNNLLMSFKFSNEETFRSLLDQVKKHRKNAKNYRWLTYPKIIACLRNQNRIGEHDFANVCLSESLGMLRKEAPEFYGTETTSLPLETFEPMFDLSFCYAVTSNLFFQIDYDSTKFDESYIRKFSEYFVNFLNYVIENPDEPINIEMLSKNTELVNQSSKMNIFSVESSLNEIFSKIANQQKTRPALIFEDRIYDYKTLEEQSNQWAHFLRLSFKKYYGREIEPDTLIGICAPRNENIIIAILAILKAGAAYIPIDPQYPEERIQHIVNDSKMPLVLTHHTNSERFKSQNSIYKIPMEDQLIIKQVRSQPTSPPEIKVKPEQLAYIIYTSGSTGRPKGVMVSHENVIRLFKSTEIFYQFTEDDVWSLFHSFSFDFSVWEMWGAFSYGGAVQLVSYELSRDPRKFYQWLKDKSITVLNQTPSAFKKLVDEDKKSLTKLNKLKYIIFGGEAIQKKCLQTWVEKYGFDLPKLINMYGITETTVHVTFKQLTPLDLKNSTSSNIGVPLNDLEIFILNEQMQLCPPEIPGEIYVAGAGLARGYLNRPELTQDRFIINPFGASFNWPARLYKSGDLGRRKTDGSIEYFGRKDFQIKIRGFRIELGEIEATLLTYPGISQAAVMLKPSNKEILLAYYKVEEGIVVEESELRRHLTANLPGYMCPHEFHELSLFPINHNGKMNVSAFPLYIINRQKNIVNESNREEYPSARNVKKIIAEIWSEILQIENFNSHDSFFNLGGDSFSIIRVREKIENNFKVTLNIVDLFQYTTLDSLAKYIESLLETPFSQIDISHEADSKAYKLDSRSRDDIAVIGMACRVPGALDSQAFWSLLVNEKSSIRDFSVEELVADGFCENLIAQPSFIKRGSVLEDAYAFDAHFFGYSAKEAQIMDPQQRQFLECAWEALENSGNIPEKFKGEIGVFASQGKNFYFLENIFNSSSLEDTSEYQTMIANEKDFLSTKVSFKLNLTGPSLNVQTGCSSSLVAIDLARQHLQKKGCDIALAGGVALFYKKGYEYHKGMIESPDGYCRAFDENAKGTVAGSGVGVVVLKRLDDAIADQDTVYAIIKGGAINNDGGSKMNFTAPSIDGQSTVIEKAIKDAGITPGDVSYIETHGTGTLLGDPIEWAALHHVYEKYVNKREFCTLGALKTNIGHADAAAGVLGFIKVVLSLKNKIIPATLNFKALNSEIARFNKLFSVVNKSTPWNNNCHIRTAGISSFGIGGTNAHLILQEYNQDVMVSHSEPQELMIIPFSAKTHDSLIKLAEKFQNFIEKCDVSQIENLAFTAQQGRTEFFKRGYFLVNSNGKILNSSWEDNPFVDFPEIIFHYPAIPCQSFSKIKVLYDKYLIFQRFFDQCYQIILEKFNLNIKEEIYESQQLASFSFQYALSELLKSFGIIPNTIVAGGNGPILAAILSGEIDLSLAIELFVYPEKTKSINITGFKNLKIISPDLGHLVLDLRKAIQFPDSDAEYLKKLPAFKNFNIITVNLMSKNEIENADIGLLDLIGRLWMKGISVSWERINKISLNARKISIPTYQFNKKIYKISKITVPVSGNSPSQASSPEAQLKELWCKILGVSVHEISESTHFVGLGGDSLSAIQLLDQIKKYFSVELLFEEIESNFIFIKMLELINSKKEIASEIHVNI